MPIYTLKGPDGKTYKIRGPEGASADELAAVIQGQQPTAPVEQKSGIGALGGALGQGVGNIALGAQNLVGMGLEKIGAEGAGKWLQQDAAQGKAKLQSEIQPYEQQFPNTVAGGRLGGEILATLPVGGVFGKSVEVAARGAGAASKAAPLVQALRTSGMQGGNLATRAGAGATVGGASGVLADQESGGTSAAVGLALPLLGPVARGIGEAGKNYLGMTTGAGTEAMTQALRAGREGGKVAQDFTSAMRGQSSMDDALTMAKQNLDAMGQQKQVAYRQGMARIKSDKTVLDLGGVDKALNDAIGMATYKGQIKNERAAQVLSNIKGEIDNWKSLNPAEYHTPEGLDALKQKIGGIIEGIDFKEKTALSAASKVYNSLKSEITQQAPEYSKVMKDYSEAADTIREIEKSLSLGNKASADTAMRKLQSLMRNNVNTNYGQRTALAQEMIGAGGQDFMPALAGQSLNSLTPRGLQGLGAGTGSGVLAYTGNLGPAALLAATSSPRLVGETMYKAGQAARVTDKVANKIDPAVIRALRQGVYKSAPMVGAGSE